MTDREAIVELLMRYAAGIDRNDIDEIAACFTDDVYSDLEGSMPDVVRMTQLRNPLGRQGIKQMSELGVFELVISPHMIGTQLVAVDGDTATSEAYCIASPIGRRDGADVALV